MKILLCEFALSGHRLSYLSSIIIAWDRANLPAPVICLPGQVQGEVNKLDSLEAKLFDGCEVKFFKSEIGSEAFLREARGKWPAQNLVLFQSNCERLITTLSSRKCSLDNIDFCLIPFKPVLHYLTFISGLKMLVKPKWLKQTIRDLYHYFKISRCDAVKSVVFIDPLAAPVFNGIFRARKFSWIPDFLQASDVMDCPPELAAIKQSSDKKILLIPGAITSRKSVEEILHALVQSRLQQELIVIIAGQCEEGYRAKFTECVAQLGIFESVFVVDRFVTDSEFEWLFQKADIVSALYRDFVGMSGVASKAIDQDKALLVSSEGLLAQLVRSEPLSKACNPNSISSIATCIMELLEARSSGKVYSKQSKAYSSKHFGEEVVKQICEIH